MVKGEFALPLKMEMLKGPKIADIDYQMMEVQNVIPMDEWRFMQEQCFSGNVTFKICFGLLGFRPDLRRSSILGPPVVRRPLSLLPSVGAQA